MNYSIGNLKIGRDTIIINMGSATNCPSGKLGLCNLYANQKCYCLKAERQYPKCLPFREKQAKQWQEMTAYEIAAFITGVQSRKRRKLKWFRVNESGDFYTQKDIDKLSKIAELIRPHGIKTYTYTHRHDLDFTGISFSINFSYTDTNGRVYKRPNATKRAKGLPSQPKGSNTFTTVDKASFAKFAAMAPQQRKRERLFLCGQDCRTCHACKIPSNLRIIAALH